MPAASLRSVDDLVSLAVGGTSLVALSVLRDGRVELPTAALRAQLGWPADVSGRPLREVVVDDDWGHVETILGTMKAEPVHVSCRVRRADGHEFEAELFVQRIDDEGHQGSAAISWLDASARHVAESQLRKLAFTDALTGLANRALLSDRLRYALAQARRSGVGFAVMVADLDGFKAVNDRFGHDAGDGVLREVAGRLGGCVRATDTIARVGGDEFTFVLPTARDAAVAGIVAGRAIRAIATPFEIAGHAVTIGLTVGIAIWPEHGAEADALLATADAALYEGKRDGKNRYRFARHSVPPPAKPGGAWHRGLALGVTSIDAQHEALAKLVDTVVDDLAQGHDRARLGVAFDSLVAATLEHFAHEERLMARIGHGGREAHEREHRRLLDDLENLSVAVDHESMAIVSRYLYDWLGRHVDTMDRVLARALRASGAQG